MPAETKSKRRRHAHRAESGQSLVELAISFVAILFVILGLIDLGRLYFTFIALEDGVGEAALYLSLNPYCVLASNFDDDGNPCTDPNNACYRAVNSGGDEVVDWSLVDCTESADFAFANSEKYVGGSVSVTVHYPVELITPLVPWLLRQTGIDQLTLSASATQQIISQ